MRPETHKEKLRSRKRDKAFKRKLAHFIVLFIVLAGAVYLLFFNKSFDVRFIEIDAPASIPEATIKTLADTWLDESSLGIKHRNNSIVFRPSGMEGVLENSFPIIKSVSVNRVSAHTISITIVERDPVGIWCIVNTEKCFYFDINGFAFAEISKSSGYLFANINDYRDRDIQLGEYVEDKIWIDNIMYVKRTLQFGGVGMKYFEISEEGVNEFAVRTAEGWDILFANDTNVRQQGETLLSFLKEKITPEERETLDYVDLRIQDRIYYKQIEPTP
ncbi:MAG: FtsQ-type POTRA domain-containing protein [Parcubacteria group bacterium]